MARLKVQVLSSNPTDACSLYRGFGPFNFMHRNDQVELVERNGVGWRESGAAHVLFVQRPHIASELAAMGVAKDAGLKIVIDYDDPFSLVPVYNPSWQALRADGSYHKNIAVALEMADVVWVSTAAIREVFLQENPGLSPDKVVVISNAWNWQDWKCIDKPGDNPHFFWRGTRTHDKDLWEMTEVLGEVLSESSVSYRVSMLGGPFWMSIEDLAEREIDLEVHNPMRFGQMLSLMRKSQAMYGLVPLCDNRFNECKSNIAALEMLACGMLPITSARSEFKLIPGVLASDNYCSTLRAALGMSFSDRHMRWKQAVEWMRDECRLDQRNEERMASMLSLV